MRARKISITEWLTNWREGDREASERLFAVVYPELRRRESVPQNARTAYRFRLYI